MSHASFLYIGLQACELQAQICNLTQQNFIFEMESLLHSTFDENLVYFSKSHRHNSCLEQRFSVDTDV
jgi:hypothetical protein